ncbi:Zinc finger protein [Plakobranchus ocellatus]|uniref:Zinc finger protein n=1 Tax=Plakobranchus ocellatus TaxID=259542 RepID=A0AAV3YJB2_9GAST|nr:Zinc finger protein [Plakobranchus ocellatus]
MSGLKCQLEPSGKADNFIQRPSYSDSYNLAVPITSYNKNSAVCSRKGPVQSYSPTTPKDVSSCGQPDPMHLFDKKEIVKNVDGKADQPLDLSVKNAEITSKGSKHLSQHKHFSGPSNAVPTIFASNPENIFKIPLPPELEKGPISSKNCRLSKAVNQTFEFRHKVPFIVPNPSVFQVKYNLFPNSVRKTPQKLSHKEAAQPHRTSLKNKSVMSEREAPQKQARLEADASGNASYMIKEEPMEDADIHFKQFYSNSVETFSTGSYQNSTPSNCFLPDSNVTQKSEFYGFPTKSEFAQKAQDTGQRDYPDSSTDSTYQSLHGSSMNKQNHATFVSSSGALHQPPGSSSAILNEVVAKQSNIIDSNHPMPSSTETNELSDVSLCQVCGDHAAGFYCGAYICEACKKFFIRAAKLKQIKYVCLKQKNCIITKESRVHCQYCRYQKCLSLNMFYLKDGQKGEDKSKVQEIPCRVCSAPSSGFHFGALTCEGCKGFFRRMVNEREPGTYKCGKGGNCKVNSMTRNMCKACRYAKCLQIGMSTGGSRIGRQPNAIKHAISLEVKKQAAQRDSSQELKLQNSMNSSESLNSNICDFEGHVLESCAPGEVEKWVTGNIQSDHSSNQQLSAQGKDGFFPPTRQMNNWRESREMEKMASSSTESLDLVGRADVTQTNFEAMGKSGVMSTEVKSEESNQQQDMFCHNAQQKETRGQCFYERTEQNYPDSSCYGKRSSYPQMINQANYHSTESAWPLFQLNPESQRKIAPLEETSQYPVAKNHAQSEINWSRNAPTRPNLMSSMSSPASTFHRERSFSEDIELLNFNISMQSEEAFDHEKARNSLLQRKKVLGMAISGPLLSSWNPKEDHGRQDYSMASFNSTCGPSSMLSASSHLSQSAPMLHSDLSLNKLSHYHPKTASCEERQIKNPFHMDYARLPLSPKSHAAASPGYTNLNQGSYDQRGMPSKQYLDCSTRNEWLMSVSDNASINDCHTYCGIRSTERDAHMVMQHLEPTNNSQYTQDRQHLELQSPKAIHSAVSGTNKTITRVSDDGMEGYSSYTGFVSTELAISPVGLKSTDVLKSSSTPCSFYQEKQPFKNPGSFYPVNSHQTGPSPCPSPLSNAGKHRHARQGSRSPSPYKNHWKHRQEIQGCGSTDACNNARNHRHASVRSRSSSPLNNAGKNEQDGLASDKNKDDTISLPSDHFRSTSSPFAPIKTPEASTPSPRASPVPVNSATIVSSSNGSNTSESLSSSKRLPQSIKLSPSGGWTVNENYMDLDMEVAAKSLRSMCLVDKAKSDAYNAEQFVSKETAWELMMKHFDFHAKAMVRYAKKVPGFRDIKLDDQVRLLSKATYNLVLLNHTRAYEPATGFYNYFNMPRRNWLHCLVSSAWEYFPEFDVLHNHFKHCGILAKELGLTEIEYAYMSCIMLLDDECEGLESVPQVKELKSIILAAFQQHQLENFPSGSLRFGQLLLRLSEFSQFSMQHQMAVVQVMTKNPHLNIPQLYAEMYN